MSAWQTWLIAGIVTLSLVGCASLEVDPPEPSRVFEQQTTQAPDEIPVPIEPPASPQAQLIEHKGQAYLAFDPASTEQLLATRAACQGNTELAAELGYALRETQAERDALVYAGRGIEARANSYGAALAHCETARNKEQQTHAIERTIDRLLLIVLGVLAVL